MLSLILVLVLLWFVLSILLAAGTLGLQGYFNETPPDFKDLLWRGPAAAGAVTAFVLLWVVLAYNDYDRFPPLTEFSADEDRPYFPTLLVKEPNFPQQRKYQLTKDERGRPLYRLNGTGGPLPARPDEIIVMEDGGEARFRPERDEKGKFKLGPNGRLRYTDDGGRYMEEGFLGQLTVSHPGRTFVYFLLNLLHAGVWFACLWPLLRFSWPQALLLTAGCWLMMTLVVLPPLLTQARDVAKKRAAQEAAQRTGGRVSETLPPGSPSHAPARGGRGARGRYFAATVGVANCRFTRVSSPARTATFSVRTSALPSRTTSAFSV